MFLMKPIHNYNSSAISLASVVIPHKVNDFNETNSQLMLVKFKTRAGCDSSQS